MRPIAEYVGADPAILFDRAKWPGRICRSSQRMTTRVAACRWCPNSRSSRPAITRGTAQVVSTRLVADLETPVSAMLKLARGEPYSFLLESVEGGAVRGRYSIIGMKPDLIWRCRGAQGRDQPARAQRPGRPLRAAGRRPSGLAQSSAFAVAHRIAGHAAAHGFRGFRLHGLRHGAADGETGGAQARSLWVFPTACSSGRPSWRSSMRSGTK